MHALISFTVLQIFDHLYTNEGNIVSWNHFFNVIRRYAEDFFEVRLPQFEPRE